VFLPRLAQHEESWPAALISGRLFEANGCVFITSDDPGSDHANVLLIWPNEATAVRTDDGRLQISIDGDIVGAVGDVVHLGGGYLGETRNRVAQAESLIGGAIPDRCRADGGYWVTPGAA
jgi:hypothetical protein